MGTMTKGAVVGLSVVGVLILQAVTMFAAYGLGLTLLLALALPAAFALHVVLFSTSLRPVPAVAAALAFTLAGTYAGAFFAFNTFGT
jgi:hypothetical protein